MQSSAATSRPSPPGRWIDDAFASGAALALAGAAALAMVVAAFGANEGAAFIASILWPTAFAVKCAEALLLRARLGEAPDIGGDAHALDAALTDLGHLFQTALRHGATSLELAPGKRGNHAALFAGPLQVCELIVSASEAATLAAAADQSRRTTVLEDGSEVSYQVGRLGDDALRVIFFQQQPR